MEKKRHSKSDSLNGYIWNISPKISKILILLKCTWNIFQIYKNTSLNKFKKSEIISSIFPNHTDTKPDINHKTKRVKQNMELKQHTTE